MFQSAINSLNSALGRYPWVAELAGILPLSALIDFIEIPPKLHVLELAGSVPLWSWAITPSGSRLLLAKPDKAGDKTVQQDCCMDRFGNALALEALDGRYGERYFASSPETLRLILEGSKVVHIENDHMNMTNEKFTRRVQNVEIIHVTRRDSKAASGAPPEAPLEAPSEAPSKAPSKAPLLGWLRGFINPLQNTSPLYQATSTGGWILWVGTLIVSVVSLLFGTQPRKLLVEERSKFVRLLVVAEHMNTATWRVVFGESSIVNSLINRPLEPTGPPPSSGWTAVCRQLLRLCILGQWGLALGAAATKRWDAYMICFLDCLSHLLPRIFDFTELLRQSLTSTRRSFVNLIVALNPDTFGLDSNENIDYDKFYSEGLKWMNPILSESNSRKVWELATREALKEVASKPIDSTVGQNPDSDFLSTAWNAQYARFEVDGKTGEMKEKYYWRRFIPEGIYLADKIKKEANLPKGKTVRTS
ncbi:hypothetical protein CEP52_006821 [Fusarium oligoseptatum]|uniref:Uncharacterized protein n=1 Tax=Fusarium oligoseptatum TaxID=2604345 RepID=A0A428TR30_9HYPO|nr:hypothetical protein CEP52_006821 [Fusarium oligoseptatum]